MKLSVKYNDLQAYTLKPTLLMA